MKCAGCVRSDSLETAERLADWLSLLGEPDRRLIYKRLSANDTGASGTHQVGPYIPNRYAFLIAPELDSDELNPRRQIELSLLSHAQNSMPALIYYNNRLQGGTRNECRLTGFGGRGSAVQDPESTGAILLLSFDSIGRTAEGWLATNLEEEDAIEAELGPIEPGTVGYRGDDETGQFALLETAPASKTCNPKLGDLPLSWQRVFPRAIELTDESVRRCPIGSHNVDDVFLRRHDCEYALFQLVERFHLLPKILSGFASVEEFLGVAQSVLQRRKSRAGRSLELQLEHIFKEEGIEFSTQATTEDGHRPDFIFPSIERYRTAAHGEGELAMLAAKSTLRDRWRQVLREADKIRTKHLFTLDEGLSVNQFRAIAAESITLVAPQARLRGYPAAVRGQVLTLRQFVDTRNRPPQRNLRP